MKTKKKLWLAVIVGVVLLFGVLGGTKAAQIVTMINAGASFAMPPESVTSAKVEKAAWQGSRTASASLVAVRGVTLAAEVPGLVRHIGFDSGTAVRQGTVLVRLDTSAEEAQLASAEAEAALARINLERVQSLRAGGSGSAADLDTAQARAKQAQAAVAALQATIAKKAIRAPFDGRIAIRQVELGQVLAAGTPIASFHSVSPIHAEFFFPQQALSALQLGQKVRLTTDAYPGAEWSGTLTTINSEVDAATRNVRVRATFDNRDGKLRPGMFGTADVLSEQKREVLLIPATAVLFAPYGDSVFTLEEQKDPAGKASLVAKQKFVRVGERRGDFVEVISGLQAGETVASTGGFKLRPGAVVVVNNALAPGAELAPKPANQ